MLLPGKHSANGKVIPQKLMPPVRVKPDEAFDLKVTVGPHPNTVEHSIRWIMVTLEEERRAFNPVVWPRYH